MLEYLPLYGTLNHFEKTLPNTCTAFPDMDDDQPLPSDRYYTDLTNTFNFILPFHGENPPFHIGYSKTISLKLHFIID
jgi:hypothetical protein